MWNHILLQNSNHNTFFSIEKDALYDDVADYIEHLCVNGECHTEFFGVSTILNRTQEQFVFTRRNKQRITSAWFYVLLLPATREWHKLVEWSRCVSDRFGSKRVAEFVYNADFPVIGLQLKK